MPMRGLLVVLCASIMISGCVDFNGTMGQSGSYDTGYGNGKQVGMAGNGQMTGSDSKSLDCGDQAQISTAINGQGQIEVTVTDGAGKEVYSKSFNGQGQSGETVERSGTAGEWTIKVQFGTAGLGFNGYQGQYAIYLRC